jgi:hypothetical protein
MAVDWNAMLSSILPLLKIFAIVVVGGIIIVAGGYYFFVIKRRKTWKIDIYELKSDGRLHLVSKDTLIERRFDNGRTIVYWLQKAAQETTPPPVEAVDRYGNQDYADYIKIRFSIVPLIKRPLETTKKDMIRMTKIMPQATKAIKTDPKYKSSLFGKPTAVENRFIYVPINKVPHISMGYNQMDYDIDMMRINQIDNIDKMFATQKQFWEKYGMYVMIGLLIVAVIVIAYLSFEYMRDVIGKTLDQTSAVVNAIKNMNLGGAAKPPVG